MNNFPIAVTAAVFVGAANNVRLTVAAMVVTAFVGFVIARREQVRGRRPAAVYQLSREN